MAWAQSLPFTNYGYGETLDNKNGGWQIKPAGAPEYLVISKNVPYNIHLCAPTTFQMTGVGTVTINSIIEVFPQGLNQKSVKYACDSGIAALQTNGF
jgi:hypothetical protein